MDCKEQGTTTNIYNMRENQFFSPVQLGNLQKSIN